MKAPDHTLIVTLTDWQLIVAEITGKERAADAMEKHFPNVFEHPREDGETEEQACQRHHIKGCLGECAASKLFNVEWPMSVTPDGKQGDCRLPNGRIAQVRTNKFPDRTSWDVYPWQLSWDAHAERTYIFCMGGIWLEDDRWEELHNVAVLGWLEGAEVQDCEKSDHLPNGTRLICAAHIVPVRALRDPCHLQLQLYQYRRLFPQSKAT